MERQQFKIQIDAPKSKVWDVLWNDISYQLWTSVFSPGSHAQTDWKEGSKVLFLDGENKGGMVSIIDRKKENELMSFKHLGIVKDGIEDTESEEVRKWAGAFENYTLTTVDGKTELTVDLDINDEYKDYFRETFPKALEKVKDLSEVVVSE